MAISKEKKRVSITITKTADDLISKFAEALGMTKSKFVQDVCLTFIKDVVAKAEKKRKNKKEA